MRIAFHLNELTLRGTGVAVFDYARHCQSILGIEPVIVSKKRSKHHDKLAIQHFESHFPLKLYSFPFQLDALCKRKQIEILYAIKGSSDKLHAKGVRNVVHGVFDTCPPHGDRFAYVSEWLADHASQSRYPAVPHIVDLPSVEGDLRADLEIPATATVLGRHGGWDTFDLEIAHRAVEQWVNLDRSNHFVGMNTKPFGPPHPQIHLLPSSADLIQKVKFINTCDAMVHARSGGETFGLAIGEFSFFNKPVFTWKESGDRAHLRILGSQALTYQTEDQLFQMLSQFDRLGVRQGDWSAYRQFSPENVMRKFKEVFIDA